MKRSHYILVLALFVTISTSALISCQREKNLTLNMMTYNIRFAADKPDPESWDNRRNGIINSFTGTDIAGLQEVLPVQVNDLKTNLPAYNIIHRSREIDPVEGEGVSLLYNKVKFRLLDSGTFWLSDTPEVPGSNTWNAACNRVVTWGRFRDNQTGIEFFVYNTHLDHVSQFARENSIKLILDTLRIMTSGSPVILMGDFNSEEDNPVYKMIKDFGLKDAYREIKSVSDSMDLTFHGWQNEKGLSRIDYIFVSPDFQVRNARVIKSKVNGIYPSDHFPVVTEIVFKKPE